VKQLISVKDHVDAVFNQKDDVILKLDCLDETVKMFLHNEFPKEGQARHVKKLFDEWTGLQKLARETRKEITPIVNNETEKTSIQIKKLEEDLKVFNGDLKKRDFYFYKTGSDEALKKLGTIDNEIKVFEERIEDYGYNMNKFGNADMITNSVKQVESIKIELENMRILWSFTKDTLG